MIALITEETVLQLQLVLLLACHLLCQLLSSLTLKIMQQRRKRTQENEARYKEMLIFLLHFLRSCFTCITFVHTRLLLLRLFLLQLLLHKCKPSFAHFRTVFPFYFRGFLRFSGGIKGKTPSRHLPAQS